MLRNLLAIILVGGVVITFQSGSLFAETAQTNKAQASIASVEQDGLKQADLMLTEGGVEKIKNALQIYIKIADQSPKNYTANWKCAKAHYLYADAVRRSGADDWQDVCKEYGKSGFQYGEKAIALAPEKVEGNLYYGLCVWKYSDGVSIARALSEGLKGSTQSAFEKSYAIDKMFDNGWPMKALGRFWHELPWPLRDYDDSLKYLEEHQQYFPDDPQGLVFLSETLIDSKDKKRAKTYLQKAAAEENQDPYYANMAKLLLEKNF